MEHPQIYSYEYYRKIYELENRHWWYLGIREIASVLLRSSDCCNHPVRILDAGCGTGGFLRWAGEFLGASTIIGIDISSTALGFCRLHHKLNATVLQLPFASDTFDLVICQDVLQHLPTNDSDRHALSEMFRVLSPGGQILVRSNSRLGMWHTAMDQDEDYRRYTLPEIISLVQSTGFIIERATYANCLPGLYASLKGLWKHIASHQKPSRLYEGLPIQDTSLQRRRLDQLLLHTLHLEALYLTAPKRKLSFGHTTFCLGMKPLV